MYFKIVITILLAQFVPHGNTVNIKNETFENFNFKMTRKCRMRYKNNVSAQYKKLYTSKISLIIPKCDM